MNRATKRHEMCNACNLSASTLPIQSSSFTANDLCTTKWYSLKHFHMFHDGEPHIEILYLECG